MEKRERELILQAIEHNPKLNRLYQRHKELDDKLARLDRRTFLTHSEQTELKKLKQEKLRGVEEMLRIISASEDQLPMAV